MKHPIEIRHDHYRELFLEARSARTHIRGSLGTPVAAAAFAVFNLGVLAQHVDGARMAEPLGLLIGLLVLGSVIALTAAVYFMMKVEWHFVHIEPPDLPELLRIENEIRGAWETPGPHDPHRDVSTELQQSLTGAYYVGYEAYMIGNARSSRFRTWALRLVLIALLYLALAFLVLPFHAPGAAA
jgi:hypothetical protein